jgi:hypothetical protein
MHSLGTMSRAKRLTAHRTGDRRNVMQALQSGLLAGLVLLGLYGCTARSDTATPQLLTTIDSHGPHDPWGKAVGDIDGDGRPDLVVGGHGSRPPSLLRRVMARVGLGGPAWRGNGSLVWYQSPDFKKHVISERFRVRTDIEVVDVDGDGRKDVVAVTDEGLVWFKNPDWAATVIDTRVLHDVEVADLDGDGKPDMVARNQALFGHANSDVLHLYRQVTPSQWVHTPRLLQTAESKNVHGEGLKLADLDGDGRPDVIVNQVWLRNPGSLAPEASWVPTAYCPSWYWPHAYIDVADMNGDGRLDIVLAPAEPVGSTYRLSWCESPSLPSAAWTEHVIDATVESAMHSVVAGDFDGDGRTDVATAIMHIAQGNKDVALYTRPGNTQTWSRTAIASTGSHSMKALDFDQDGDLDLFGANLWGGHQPVEMWINPLRQRTAAGWKRHVIDARMPWRSVFVHAADINADGRKDLVAGGRWYEHPGSLGAVWRVHEIGAGANNVALIHDFNGDGTLDVLASTWNHPRAWTWRERLANRLGKLNLGAPGGLVWSKNDGHGRFVVMNNLPQAAGDFLQGVALLRHESRTSVALSWHQTNLGIEELLVPAHPEREPWRIRRLSTVSQDEQITAVDIDRDGRTDLMLGTQWLAGVTWNAHAIHTPLGKPDRHQVVDLDGDGRLDVVVGYEAVNAPGLLAWYRQGSDPKAPWMQHTIATLTGPMSLGVGDMDGDGDIDIVVGEHNLAHPGAARLIWYENVAGDGSRWVAHVIHIGDEHHNGALVVDMDGDGDLDIVSIGWGHEQLLLYENLSR